jgi:hypothetical protein
MVSLTPIAPPATIGYTSLTQDLALILLSERTGDPNFIYWTRPEWRTYINEALHTWQAFTAWHRTRDQVTLQPGMNWYDLPIEMPQTFGYNIRDSELASTMMYQLLEAQIVSGAWLGTDMFDAVRVQAALQTRLNRWLGDTGAVVSYFRQNTGISPGSSRLYIGPNNIDVRRVAWLDAASVATPLWRSSVWETHSFGIPSAGTPMVYSQDVNPPISIDLHPVPVAPGVVEVISVQSNPTLTLLGVLLNVPDDFAWGVKWGALADLLSGEGQGKDLLRATYCEQRYQESVQLAKGAPSVLAAHMGGTPYYVGSVFELDAFSSGWQNVSAGVPVAFSMAGRNLFAVSPAPAIAMNMTLDLVRNMPMPVGGADVLQIPPDVIPAFLDYVVHIAAFKMGGSEFQATNQLRANFVLEAANYNSRIRQFSFYNDALRGPGQIQQAEMPRIEQPTLALYVGQGGGQQQQIQGSNG